MSDAVTLARTARESLARGLNALQADPNVPQHLLELAAPIAQAMGALHQIERSGGAQVSPHAEAALANVQTALMALQAQPPQYAAVATALESVAGALGSVHALTRAVAPQAPPPQAAMPPPQAAPAPVSPSRSPPRPGPAQPAAQAPRAGQPVAAPTGDAITAELGAHSPTNFYKGLAGNDIIDHGGLFVSTYKLPKIGSSVRPLWPRCPAVTNSKRTPWFGGRASRRTPATTHRPGSARSSRR